jgi:hypothetical protein
VSWALWFTLVIPTLGSWRQEDLEFEASLGYIAGVSQKTKTKHQQKKNRLYRAGVVVQVGEHLPTTKINKQINK